MQPVILTFNPTKKELTVQIQNDILIIDSGFVSGTDIKTGTQTFQKVLTPYEQERLIKKLVANISLD